VLFQLQGKPFEKKDLDDIVQGDWIKPADILLTQRAAHGWLLTGHYSYFGVHHPGPFFLYVRLLGQWLAGGLTGSVFSAQLVGVMACSAGFAGLFTALLHRLARRTGACDRTAAAAAVAALVLVLVQFSVKDLTGGKGADVVYDPVGGDVFDESVRCIAFNGRLLVVGFTSGRIPTISVNMPLIKGFSVMGVRAGEYSRRFPQKRAETMRAIFDAGLRVPEDIAVVGCGNLSYSDFLRVPLTSVDQNSKMIGKMAATQALKMAESKTPVPRKSALVALQLVVRASSLRKPR